MRKKLNIVLVQTELFWEEKFNNLARFDNLIREIENADVIVLPEMFTTGFSMQTEKLFERMDGTTVNWLKTKAKEKNCAICGSIIIREGEKNYNRFVWAEEGGNVFSYNKRHLFRMANENQYFEAGNSPIIIPYKGWNIRPLVCYDLRFPVWSRNIQNGYDLLIYVANWPEARRKPWMKLLQARAIENQCYVIGVNRIGMDGRNIDHSGDSMIIDPKGEVLQHALKEEKIISAEISLDELNDFREKFPVSMDADEFSID
jgi:predicted amidohydrolase